MLHVVLFWAFLKRSQKVRLQLGANRLIWVRIQPLSLPQTRSWRLRCQPYPQNFRNEFGIDSLKKTSLGGSKKHLVLSLCSYLSNHSLWVSPPWISSRCHRWFGYGTKAYLVPWCLCLWMFTIVYLPSNGCMVFDNSVIVICGNI